MSVLRKLFPILGEYFFEECVPTSHFRGKQIFPRWVNNYFQSSKNIWMFLLLPSSNPVKSFFYEFHVKNISIQQIIRINKFQTPFIWFKLRYNFSRSFNLIYRGRMNSHPYANILILIFSFVYLSIY